MDKDVWQHLPSGTMSTISQFRLSGSCLTMYLVLGEPTHCSGEPHYNPRYTKQCKWPTGNATSEDTMKRVLTSVAFSVSRILGHTMTANELKHFCKAVDARRSYFEDIQGGVITHDKLPYPPHPTLEQDVAVYLVRGTPEIIERIKYRIRKRYNVPYSALVRISKDRCQTNQLMVSIFSRVGNDKQEIYCWQELVNLPPCPQTAQWIDFRLKQMDMTDAETLLSLPSTTDSGFKKPKFKTYQDLLPHFATHACAPWEIDHETRSYQLPLYNIEKYKSWKLQPLVFCHATTDPYVHEVGEDFGKEFNENDVNGMSQNTDPNSNKSCQNSASNTNGGGFR